MSVKGSKRANRCKVLKKVCEKGYHLSIKGIRKEFLFHENLYIKGFGVDLGAEPPCTNSPPPPRYQSSKYCISSNKRPCTYFKFKPERMSTYYKEGA